jgi:streptogramin lyase
MSSIRYGRVGIAAAGASGIAADVSAPHAGSQLVLAGRPSITEFSLPAAQSGPIGIAAGPDGAKWFTEDAIRSAASPYRKGPLGDALVRLG